MIGLYSANSQAIGGGGFTGLLDTYGGAAAAYSVRRLSSNYTGALIEVRRSSDNTTQDIGYDANGNLDTTSLLSFVGAGDGFVRTWYDQSGNTNNAQQTTSSRQPQIVSSGTVLTLLGNPTLDFTGGVFMTHSPLTGSALAYITIHNNTNPFSTFNSLYSSRKNGSTFTNFGYTLLYSNDSPTNTVFIQTRYGSGISGMTYTGAVTGNKLTFHSNDGAGAGISTHEYYVNDVLKSSTSTASPISFSASNDYIIGADGTNGISSFIGNMSEVVIYTTDQSSNRTGIQNNLNSYYSIY